MSPPGARSSSWLIMGPSSSWILGRPDLEPFSVSESRFWSM